MGFITGFATSYSHSNTKRKLNKKGVVDSNSVIFHFLIPSLFAAVLSTILQGIGQSSLSYTYTTASTASANTIVDKPNMGPGRENTLQAGYQMAGWGISIALGAIGGLLVGLAYRLLNDSFKDTQDFFNDKVLY